MANDVVKQLRHSKEGVYGAIVMVLGGIIWALILVGIAFALTQDNGAMQVVIIVVELAVLVGILQILKLFYRAWLFGHAVLVSEKQFPALHQRLTKGAQKLGMSGPPQTFVYNSHGLTNAFALRIFQTRMVLLTSAILDVGNDQQVDFIIGHELGHHVAGHLSFWKNVLKYPGLIVPFLGPAYHRARELTADRIGAFCSGNYEASRTALQMLACGSAKLNATMNANAFSEQESQVPAITGFLLHIFSGYPRLTRRVREIESLYRSYQSQAPTPTAAPVPAE